MSYSNHCSCICYDPHILDGHCFRRVCKREQSRSSNSSSHTPCCWNVGKISDFQPQMYCLYPLLITTIYCSLKHDLLNLFSWFIPDIDEFCIGRLCNRCSSSLPCGILDSCALWKNGLAKVVRKQEPKQGLTVIWLQSRASSKIILERLLASFYLLTCFFSFFFSCNSHSSLSPNCFKT